MTDNLQPLIHRLEEAEGPDRRIDADLWDTLELVDERHCEMWCKQDGRTDLTRERFVLTWAPRYTESLDAAVSLVPEGRTWMVSVGLERSGASLSVPYDIDAMSSACATPALALCIAALRAIQAQREETET